MENSYQTAKADALKLYLKQRRETMRALEVDGDVAVRELSGVRENANNALLLVDQLEKTAETQRAKWQDQILSTQERMAAAFSSCRLAPDRSMTLDRSTASA